MRSFLHYHFSFRRTGKQLRPLGVASLCPGPEPHQRTPRGPRSPRPRRPWHVQRGVRLRRQTQPCPSRSTKSCCHQRRRVSRAARHAHSVYSSSSFASSLAAWRSLVVSSIAEMCAPTARAMRLAANSRARGRADALVCVAADTAPKRFGEIAKRDRPCTVSLRLPGVLCRS